jgi:hypothetical protein
MAGAIRMVEHKPYAVVIYPVTQPLNEGVFGNPVRTGVALTTMAYVEETTPGEAMERFGGKVREPALLLCELAAAELFQPDFEVLVGRRMYRVVGRGEIHDAGDEADHAEIILEFKEYTLGAP